MKTSTCRAFVALTSFALLLSTGCGSGAEDSAFGESNGAPSSTSTTTAGAGGAATTGTASGTMASTGSGNAGAGGDASGATSTATTSGGTGGGSTVADPELSGPLAIKELDATANVAATGNQVPVHVAHPTSGGPYPTVVVGHGFQLPASQYYSYVNHLATFGYVAIAVDFPASFIGNKHITNAKDMLGALDWADANLSGIADTQSAGASGHSLGGKAALLAASMDQRIQASITLDPVDSAVNCAPSDCPDVSALLPFDIPTAFIGETIDSVGALQACAPAADNFLTFYANAKTPSMAFTVLGANHMSFLDNPQTCGLPCAFCNPATVAGATVTKLSRALMVAFYERYLKGKVDYDAYLTGAVAKKRYVESGQITIQSK